VRGAGVCHSDLHIVEEEARPRPLVLGHEIAAGDDDSGEVTVYPAWGAILHVGAAGGRLIYGFGALAP
jgi:threonine dehydrogenase-like Zn-dependent dehydrogenase